MSADALDISWRRVGFAAALAWGFFLAMLLAGVYLVHWADPASPAFTWWAPATGSGTALLFILTVFALARRDGTQRPSLGH